MVVVVILLSAVVLFGAYFLGRFAVARASGVRGVKATLGLHDDAWEGVSLVRRIATSVGGFVGYYVGAALLIALGFVISGSTTIDETSMRVNVGPDGPAARAGVVDGDRILSVADVPIPDWNTLRSEIAKHPGESVNVRIERNATQRTIAVTPSGNGAFKGKIMVGPRVQHEDVSFGAALGRGFEQPFVVIADLARGVFRSSTGDVAPEMSGPVSIVRETNSASKSGLGYGLRMVGALASYLFFIAVAVSGMTVPRPQKKPEGRPA